MDIEGEAASAIRLHLVIAEGEKGAGVDVKRNSSHLEADNLLAFDEREPMDDQEQVRGSIPSEILFLMWVKAFRTSCGYNFPMPMGGANTGPRPMKQRC